MIAVFVLVLVGGVFLVGALVGQSCSRRVLRSEVRRLAEARRLFGEEWRAAQIDRIERRREVAPWG